MLLLHKFGLAASLLTSFELQNVPAVVDELPILLVSEKTEAEPEFLH